MKRQTAILVLKLLVALSLFTGIIATIFVLFLSITHQKIGILPSPSPTITQQPVEGKFCGGIAGIQCPTGYTCQLTGNYPDAGGKCVKTIYCPQDIKMCPNGKSSRRVGPKCEFEPCT